MTILFIIIGAFGVLSGYHLIHAGNLLWAAASKALPTRRRVARKSIGFVVLTLGMIVVGMNTALILGALIYAITSTQPTPAWAIDAQANNGERHQVIRFKREIQDGQRIDRDDPYLPPLLDEDARHGRAENFDRCRVAVAIYEQTGQVARVGFDDPTTLFTVQVGGMRWLDEGADEVVLEDLACFFAAGDVRRKVRFPVLDEHGRPLGEWRYGRYVKS